MTIVLDASVVLDWFFKPAAARLAYAEAALAHVIREGAIVPPLWPYETANVLLSAQRRGRLSAAVVAEADALLSALRIEVVPTERRAETRRMLELGERYGLSAYDAAYLALAMGEGRMLATNDAALRAAALRAGASIFAVAES